MKKCQRLIRDLIIYFEVYSFRFAINSKDMTKFKEEYLVSNLESRE